MGITQAKGMREGRLRAMACVRAAEGKKARDCVVLDMRKISSIADYFVICSGDSSRQVKAIADGVMEDLKTSGTRCWHSEGWSESGWIVLDFGDVIVHVFQDNVRTYYQIERLWGDAPKKQLKAQGNKAKDKNSTSLKLKA